MPRILDHEFTPDVTIIDSGTIFELDLLTDAARKWADANLTYEPRQRVLDTLLIEPERLTATVGQMRAGGLRVEPDRQDGDDARDGQPLSKPDLSRLLLRFLELVDEESRRAGSALGELRERAGVQEP
ncbi:MAG TPA: hypothetical protein VE998_08100 [Terriglobales bacterium]|nr:hypothetical protein [Terriglobales bacterium]